MSIMIVVLDPVFQVDADLLAGGYMRWGMDVGGGDGLAFGDARWGTDEHLHAVQVPLVHPAALCSAVLAGRSPLCCLVALPANRP